VRHNAVGIGISAARRHRRIVDPLNIDGIGSIRSLRRGDRVGGHRSAADIWKRIIGHAAVMAGSKFGQAEFSDNVRSNEAT
jgi:hypothetical protein